MYKGLLFNTQNQSKTNEFLIFTFVCISSIILFAFLIGGINFIFIGNSQGLDTSEITNFNHSEILYLKLLNLILQLGILGIPAFFIPYFLHLKPLNFLQINRKISIKDTFLFVFLMLATIPITEWLIDINSQMSLPSALSDIENWMKVKETQSSIMMNTFLETSTISGLVFNLFIIAVTPAILEELFFRGLLQNMLIRWVGKPILSIILTAFVFSAIHLQFYGFLPRMYLGVILGFSFYWSKNIWVPIILHFINNALTVIFVYLTNNGLTNFNIEEGMETNNLTMIVSFAIASVAFISLAIYYQKRKNKSGDWVNIFQTNSVSEAEILKGRLENEGINVVVINKRDSSYASFGPVEIHVQPEFAEQAIEIIHKETNLTSQDFEEEE